MATEDNKENIIKRAYARMLKFMGVTVPTTNESSMPVKRHEELNIGAYSYAEMENLPDFSKKDNSKNPNNDVITYLKELANLTKQKTIEAKNLKVLTPEIDQAKAIYVGSIMSPNDMQTDAIGINVNIPDLSIEAIQEVNEFLTEFFNKKMNLGNRIVKWLGDTLFESGAQPVLVLPKINIRHLSKLNNIAEVRKDLKASELEVSVESLLDTAMIKEDVEHSEESILDHIKIDDKAKLTNSVVAGVSKLIRDHKSHIVISSNIKVLMEQKNKTASALNDFTKKMDEVFLGDKGNKSVMVIDTEDELNDEDHPILLEIPSHAVVPVTIPGNKSEHIGYFVLLDEWGTPINPFSINATPTGSVSGRLASSNVQTIFGGATNIAKQMSDVQKMQCVNEVFGSTIKAVMLNLLKQKGIEGVSVKKYEAISNYIFHSLIAISENENKAKIKLLFVPASSLVYYAFDYRDDGSGKSLIEDLSLVLALRNTLYIAGVMAATKNAIDNKVVEIQVDEKNVNLEQTLDMVRNLYTEKHMYRFDHNPLAIARDIVQKSLTIVPRGIKGLADSLNVTTDHRQSNVVAPDNELIERLTNMIISGIGVPHSALNQLSETEYAKSVATNNLFFSNIIRNKQKLVNEFNTKLIRLILKYSTPLQRSLARILENYVVESVKDAKKSSSDKIKTKTIQKKDIKKLVTKIITNVVSELPSPAISTDKSHFEELRTFMEILDNVVDRIFSDDLLSGEAAELKEQLGTTKALVKASLLKEFLERVGYQGSFEIPNIEDVDYDTVHNLAQQLMNFKKGIENQTKVLKGEATTDEGGDTGGSGW